jgi:hypothetical protein
MWINPNWWIAVNLEGGQMTDNNEQVEATDDPLFSSEDLTIYLDRIRFKKNKFPRTSINKVEIRPAYLSGCGPLVLSVVILVIGGWAVGEVMAHIVGSVILVVGLLMFVGSIVSMFNSGKEIFLITADDEKTSIYTGKGKKDETFDAILAAIDKMPDVMIDQN